MDRKLKKFFVVILIIAVLFSFLGCFRMLFYRVSQTETYSEQFPLHDVRNIAVDSNGNIYLGLSSFSAIQVYDEHGQFLFGISFKNTPKGGFYFYVDSEKFVHVFSEGLLIEYVFSDEGLMGQKQILMKDIELLFDVRDRTNNPEFITGNGILYTYGRFSKKIFLYDAKKNILIKEIILDAPKWPWTFGMYFLIGFIAMLILVLMLMSKELFKKMLGSIDDK